MGLHLQLMWKLWTRFVALNIETRKSSFTVTSPLRYIPQSFLFVLKVKHSFRVKIVHKDLVRKLRN